MDRDDLGKRVHEFEYVTLMGQFYKKWIKDTFSKDVEVQCDEMVAGKQSILNRLDTSVLLEDHRRRGIDVFHFYLCHFRPLWTDCTCEGYHAENFAMMLWQKPTNDDPQFLAEKNCTVVSHEISHEFLRQKKIKNQAELIHDIWSKHTFNGVPFEMYAKNFERTTTNPYFATIDASSFR